MNSIDKGTEAWGVMLIERIAGGLVWLGHKQ